MVPFFAASEKLMYHKPGLKNERLSSLSSLQILNRHNSAILAHRINVWLPCCSSWQADFKYVDKYHVIKKMEALF